MSDLTERLARCHASPVHDVMREMGYGNCVLPPETVPLDRGMKLAGEIYTLSGHVDQTLSRHESLLRWARFCRKRRWQAGVSAQYPRHRLDGRAVGAALMVKDTKGYLMDGHCRDVADILEMEFPVFGRLSTPADIMERWTYDALGAPITIGTVTIRSGDYLIADMDGAVVPQEIAEAAVTQTEKVMAEERTCAKPFSTVDPEQAYLKYNRF